MATPIRTDRFTLGEQLPPIPRYIDRPNRVDGEQAISLAITIIPLLATNSDWGLYEACVDACMKLHVQTSHLRFLSPEYPHHSYFMWCLTVLLNDVDDESDPENPFNAPTHVRMADRRTQKRVLRYAKAATRNKDFQGDIETRTRAYLYFCWVVHGGYHACIHRATPQQLTTIHYHEALFEDGGTQSMLCDVNRSNESNVKALELEKKLRDCNGSDLRATCSSALAEFCEQDFSVEGSPQMPPSERTLQKFVICLREQSIQHAQRSFANMMSRRNEWNRQQEDIDELSRRIRPPNNHRYINSREVMSKSNTSFSSNATRGSDHPSNNTCPYLPSGYSPLVQPQSWSGPEPSHQQKRGSADLDEQIDAMQDIAVDSEDEEESEYDVLNDSGTDEKFAEKLSEYVLIRN